VRKNTGFAPLETRLYKFKKPAMKFFCPLCRTERAFTIRPSLNAKHHIQIALISLCLMGLTHSFMGWRAFFWFFFVWSAFELAVRILFKREIPCPHCGFDASWYKRDVVKARSKVEEFWQRTNGQEPDITNKLSSSVSGDEILNSDLSA